MTTSPTKNWLEDDIAVLDRSTLEQWSVCPMQAGMVEAGKAIRESEILNVGVAAHEVLGRATDEYIAAAGAITDPRELIGVVENWLSDTRPDITTKVYHALRPSLWAWSSFILDRRPSNILRYDGGAGERSGQLSYDIDSLSVRVTSEIDLLYAGPSPQVLHETDYKTGHAHWTVQDVKQAFQFQLHAVLIFANYPKVDCVEISVWDTRKNRRTFTVPFFRSEADMFRWRINKTIGVWHQERSKPELSRLTWPEADKCAACPVAQLCPRCTSVTTDPVALLESLIVLNSARANVMKQLSATVKRTGRDVVTPAGDAFGKCKPPSNNPKPNAIYSTKAADDAEEESEGE